MNMSRKHLAQPSLTGVLALVAATLMISHTAMAAPIHDAAKSGNLELVQRLVVDGADVNAQGVNAETPLIMAALEGRGEIVSYLLQRGADIGARSTSGLTALHAAAYRGHADISVLLLSKGADVNDARNHFGVSPLHMAAEENHTRVVETLLDLGANANATEINGYSVLSRAGFREHWDVAELLLAHGAVCQPADKVGEWLYQECTSLAATN